MQKEISNLMRLLEMLKNEAKLLSSRLQQWSLLDDTMKVTALRSHQKDSKQFFITKGKIRAFKKVQGLMAAVNFSYNPEQRRLFIDSSVHNLNIPKICCTV